MRLYGAFPALIITLLIIQPALIQPACASDTISFPMQAKDKKAAKKTYPKNYRHIIRKINVNGSILETAMTIKNGRLIKTEKRFLTKNEKEEFLNELKRQGLSAKPPSQWEIIEALMAEKQGNRAEKKSQKELFTEHGKKHAKYIFYDYKGNEIHAGFSMFEDDYSYYISKFGYTNKEIERLCYTSKELRAKQKAEKKRKIKSNRRRANKDTLIIPASCEEKAKKFLKSRGFILTESISYDMPELVENDRHIIKTLASELNDTFNRHKYTEREKIEALLAFVQTAIDYKALPVSENGKHTGGLRLSADTLIRGEGDCDAKSLLLAVLIAETGYFKVIGIDINKHYFIGVTMPAKEKDETIEYKGETYVLMEPAGPAKIPAGTIGEFSKQEIKNKRYGIEQIHGRWYVNNYY